MANIYLTDDISLFVLDDAGNSVLIAGDISTAAMGSDGSDGGTPMVTGLSGRGAAKATQGPFTATGSTTEGSPFITVDDATGLSAGQRCAGQGVPDGSVIVAVAGSTVELNVAATATAQGVALFAAVYASL